MEKPIKPTEPKWKDFPTPKEPNGKNYLGDPLYTKLDFVKALQKYNKDLEKYKTDMETYEQIKLIKLVKNSTEKYCLKALKITRR